MKRTSVFVTIGFLAGLGVGFFAHSAGIGRLLRRDTHTADLAAIEKLQQDEVKSTLSQDPKGLADLWTEDAVRFSPGRPPDVGKQAILANQKFGAEYPGLNVLSYASKNKDIQIEDGIACAWGEHEAQFRLSPEAPPTNWKAKTLSVLKRQSDGSWKAVAGIGYQ